MICYKDHSDIQEILDELPFDDGNTSISKCPGCAYLKGINDGSTGKKLLNLNKILTNLDDTTNIRYLHRSALAAYIKGYYYGMSRSLSFTQEQSITESPKENLDSEDIESIHEELASMNLISSYSNIAFYPEIKRERILTHLWKILEKNNIMTIYDLLKIDISETNLIGAGRKTKFQYKKLILFGHQVAKKIFHSDPTETINLPTNFSASSSMILAQILGDNEKVGIVQDEFNRYVGSIPNVRAQKALNSIGFDTFLKYHVFQNDDTLITLQDIDQSCYIYLTKCKIHIEKYIQLLVSKEQSL